MGKGKKGLGRDGEIEERESATEEQTTQCSDEIKKGNGSEEMER